MSILDTIMRKALSVEEWCMAYAMFVIALSQQLADGTSEAIFGDLLSADRHANVDAVITVVVIGVVAIVGILIYANVEATIDITNSELSQSADSVTGGFGDAMELVPIVMIVLVAAVVIGVIAQFRRR